MKKILFSLIILLICCQKEDTSYTINNRNLYIGDYCGKKFIEDDFYGCFTNIRKSETDSNKIIFEDFIVDEDIEAIISGSMIAIPDTSFLRYTHNHFSPNYSYNIVLSAEGYMDFDNYRIWLTYKVLSIKANDTIGIKSGHIELFNTSMYNYQGKYTGDSASVLLSEVNDSLYVTIGLQTDSLKYSWENIKAEDFYCYFIFEKDNVLNPINNDYSKLAGCGVKLGNELLIIIKIFQNDETSSSEYMFFVNKTD